MQFEELKAIVQGAFPEAILGEDLNATPRAMLVAPAHLRDVCQFLLENETTYFDSLSCLTGIDNGEEAGTMELAYNLYSIPYDLHLMLKVSLDRKEPSIATVSDIWRTANWHEREAFDLLGIQFENHPDLRRLLLPDDWEGYPLRKDYVEQEKYHEVKVRY